MPRVRKIRRRKINQAARRIEAEVDSILPSRFQHEQTLGGANRVVFVGSRIFNLKLAKLVADEPDLEVVATADTVKDAYSVPNEFGAELAVVEVDFGGVANGIVLARDLNERSPSCAFLLVCGHFTESVAQHLWVYGTEAWSVVSQATASNPKSIAEAISSAVRGITWVEPGIQRDLKRFGPRSRSLDERKLAMFDIPPRAAA